MASITPKILAQPFFKPYLACGITVHRSLDFWVVYVLHSCQRSAHSRAFIIYFKNRMDSEETKVEGEEMAPAMEGAEGEAPAAEVVEGEEE